VDIKTEAMNVLRVRFGHRGRNTLVECWVNYAVGLDKRDDCLGNQAIDRAIDRLDVELRSDADLLFDGELRLIGDKKTIFVRRGIEPSRRSFTIAHEIGHAALFQLAPSIGQDGDEVERMCNLFAAELLLPASSVRREVTGGSYVRALAVLAGKSGASLTSTCIRFTECFGGAAGIADADGKVIRSYGREADSDEIAGHLWRIASAKQRSFLTQRVSPAWALETGFVKSRYVFVLRREGVVSAGHTQVAD
jgi:IrrE N-terminal-like domain